MKTDYPISCELEFFYEDPYEVEVTLSALSPETGEEKSRRGTVKLERDGNSLRIKFQAKDLTVLRSMINTYTRWINIIEKTKLIKGGQ
ncbi:MAG: KEOPS complex subunit Pcc1 [Candidatus Odinarchaeota archaeon]